MIGSSRHPIHGTLLSIGQRRLETLHGDFTAHVFESFPGRSAMLAVAAGDLAGGDPLLTRVHSSCVTSEAYGARDCDCAEQLGAALAEIAAEGRGVVFYLMQEGRGAGFLAKARDRMIVQASRHRVTTFEAYEQMGLGNDLRRYDDVAFARRLLGSTAPLRLLSNNPEKVAALEAAGVAVESIRSLPSSVSAFNVHYIASKTRCGHTLEAGEALATAADLPEEVEFFEPCSLGGEPPVIHVASYLLPVTPDGDEDEIVWLRVHVYFDPASNRESVVLTYGEPARKPPLVYLHEEDLFDRFPLRRPGWARRRWRAAVSEMVSHGAGCVLARNAEGLRGSAEDLEAAASLIAHHLPGGRAHPVIDRRSGGVDFCDALLLQGIRIERRVLLDEE